MREIKFRAWHKRAKEMERVTGMDTNTLSSSPFTHIHTLCNAGEDHEETYPAQDVDLMQFTGLTDKNGKEIYEGDIVETIVLESLPPERIPVEYKQGWFAPVGDDEWVGYEFEVIGNVHENPELLEKK